jgi:hypothetical protein
MLVAFSMTVLPSVGSQFTRFVAQFDLAGANRTQLREQLSLLIEDAGLEVL